MKIQFCGVRGSTPSPGAEFARVGGHTSSLAVTPRGAAVPRLLLDAGTGIRTVTELLGGHAFVGTILLTHLHWDHTQGLPFFGAADRDDAYVRVLLPEQGDDPVAVFGRAMSPPHFPIDPMGLRGDWRFEGLEEGTHRFETIEVTAGEVTHKGGRTFGYRLSDEDGSVAYLPDHNAFCGEHDGDAEGPVAADDAERRAAAIELVRGCDVLIHDAQFFEREAVIGHDFGHSTVDDAARFALEAEVRELVLFHHSPGRTDAALDDEYLAAQERWGDRGLALTLAVEGLEIEPRRL